MQIWHFTRYLHFLHELLIFFIIYVWLRSCQCQAFLAPRYHGHSLSSQCYDFCLHLAQPIYLIFSPLHTRLSYFGDPRIWWKVDWSSKTFTDYWSPETFNMIGPGSQERKWWSRSWRSWKEGDERVSSPVSGGWGAWSSGDGGQCTGAHQRSGEVFDYNCLVYKFWCPCVCVCVFPPIKNLFNSLE